MSLQSRVSKLEENMTTNDFVTFVVFSGEDPSVKQAEAWQDYLANGGRQEYSKTSFVRINKIANDW